MKWIVIAIAVLVGIGAAVALAGALLPKSHVVSRSSRFRRSRQAVWGIITGPAEWRPDIRAVEQLPPKNGHRMWKETDRHGQAITYESVEETPPARLVTRIADPKLPFGGTWTHELSVEGEDCVLKITEAGEIYNPIFRFMARFVFGYSGSIDGYLKALHTKLGD